MRLLIATDAWHPQVNGVVRTYQHLTRELERQGHELFFITPKLFKNIPCPTYNEIRLSLLTKKRVGEMIESFGPDHIHIATEGPIGYQVRANCRKIQKPFTTAYHTRFPEYISARFPIPLSWSYGYQRWFHNGGSGMMVATRSLSDDLKARGFNNIVRWTRGVDTDLFYPRDARLFGDKTPVFIYVGRVAIEKNIEAFLTLDLPGKKVVIGAGPQLEELRQRFPDVTFTGPKEGEDLARHFASADIFVFPSLTDTFGIVMLEAMASGLPVAAYPVTGPKDVVEEGITGALNADLKIAVLAALTIDREKCRNRALEYSWPNSARQFLNNLYEANSKLKKNASPDRQAKAAKGSG